ncbi:MAG: DUF952 domain-containing protein, partial [Micrococcaceae bacterium]|nr:DUF952 domain-containing protein [Micrococcaceae bacterium]
MRRILHLAELWDWEAAQVGGLYRCSTRGATLAEVGFIHCSDPGQLRRVASVIYADYPGQLVVLELDQAAIAEAGAQIRWEHGSDGEKFPHLYGELKIGWVQATFPATMDGAQLVSPGLLP